MFVDQSSEVRLDDTGLYRYIEWCEPTMAITPAQPPDMAHGGLRQCVAIRSEMKHNQKLVSAPPGVTLVEVVGKQWN